MKYMYDVLFIIAQRSVSKHPVVHELFFPCTDHKAGSIFTNKISFSLHIIMKIVLVNFYKMADNFSLVFLTCQQLSIPISKLP